MAARFSWDFREEQSKLLRLTDFIVFTEYTDAYGRARYSPLSTLSEDRERIAQSKMYSLARDEGLAYIFMKIDLRECDSLGFGPNVPDCVFMVKRENNDESIIINEQSSVPLAVAEHIQILNEKYANRPGDESSGLLFNGVQKHTGRFKSSGCDQQVELWPQSKEFVVIPQTTVDEIMRDENYQKYKHVGLALLMMILKSYRLEIVNICKNIAPGVLGALIQPSPERPPSQLTTPERPATSGAGFSTPENTGYRTQMEFSPNTPFPGTSLDPRTKDEWPGVYPGSVTPRSPTAPRYPVGMREKELHGQKLEEIMNPRSPKHYEDVTVRKIRTDRDTTQKYYEASYIPTTPTASRKSKKSVDTLKEAIVARFNEMGMNENGRIVSNDPLHVYNRTETLKQAHQKGFNDWIAMRETLITQCQRRVCPCPRKKHRAPLPMPKLLDCDPTNLTTKSQECYIRDFIDPDGLVVEGPRSKLRLQEQPARIPEGVFIQPDTRLAKGRQSQTDLLDEAEEQLDQAKRVEFWNEDPGLAEIPLQKTPYKQREKHLYEFNDADEMNWEGIDLNKPMMPQTPQRSPSRTPQQSPRTPQQSPRMPQQSPRTPQQSPRTPQTPETPESRKFVPFGTPENEGLVFAQDYFAESPEEQATGSGSYGAPYSCDVNETLHRMREEAKERERLQPVSTKDLIKGMYKDSDLIRFLEKEGVTLDQMEDMPDEILDKALNYLEKKKKTVCQRNIFEMASVNRQLREVEELERRRGLPRFTYQQSSPHRRRDNLTSKAAYEMKTPSPKKKEGSLTKLFQK